MVGDCLDGYAGSSELMKIQKRHLVMRDGFWICYPSFMGFAPSGKTPKEAYDFNIRMNNMALDMVAKGLQSIGPLKSLNHSWNNKL